MILQNLTLEILPHLKNSREEALTLIKKLETPSEEIMAKYSEEEIMQKLRELRSSVEEAIKVEEIIRSSQNRVSDEDFKSRLNLLKDFINKVVEPKYCGNLQEAIHDLMQKAIIEQDNQEKRRHQ